MLGHLPKGSDATTSIYAPYDPDYCQEAAAIEDMMKEIRQELRKTHTLYRAGSTPVSARFGPSDGE